MRPFAHAEGHDLPWLVDEVVPGLAAQRDDVFVGFEDPVRQPVVAHELPDILHRVQLGRSWRQRQDGDVVGDRQLGRQVPTGLIDDQHRMGAGIDGGTDLDAPPWRRCRTRAFPLRGTDRAEDISVRWSRGARGRVPRLAHRRVSLFFWPMRASCHHSSISTPFGSLARIFASSAGKFFLKPRRPARFAP